MIKLILLLLLTAVAKSPCNDCTTATSVTRSSCISGADSPRLTTCSQCTAQADMSWRIEHTRDSVITKCVPTKECVSAARESETAVCFSHQCGFMPEDTSGKKIWWYEGQYTVERCATDLSIQKCIEDPICAYVLGNGRSTFCEFKAFTYYVDVKTLFIEDKLPKFSNLRGKLK